MNTNNSFNSKYFQFKGGVLLMILTIVQLFSAHASSEQASQMIKMTPNKRIEASICADSMNRIAVSNDRITQIFGDEGAFESQNDESTGQVFLKPTAENGSKSLSLTLITEQGVTQDLTLKPIAKTAKTLVLKRDTSSYNPNFQNPANQEGLQRIPGSRLNFEKSPPPDQLVYGTNDLQAQLIAFLKQAITGQFPVAKEEGTSRRYSSPEGYSITPAQSWQAGPYEISSYHIKNITETSLNLQEKDFYQPGDLALSFDTHNHGMNASDITASNSKGLEKRVLAPQETITLYVARIRKTETP